MKRSLDLSDFMKLHYPIGVFYKVAREIMLNQKRQIHNVGKRLGIQSSPPVIREIKELIIILNIKIHKFMTEEFSWQL